MGGKAFSQPADRLDSAQLANLAHHCAFRLSDVLTTVVPLLHFTNKESHGDSDLVCGWDLAPPHQTIRGADSSDSPTHGTLTEFAHVISARIGGKAWKRFGGEINVAVPSGKDDKFYQVDILLRNPTNADFSQFILSYGPTRAILLLAVNITCPQIVLHDHLLNLIYSPFVGLPKIVINLTSSPLAFCDWFGLDYDRWKAGAFDSPLDLWEWLTAVQPGSLAAEAWEKIVKGAETPTKGLKPPGSKLNDVIAFIRWLRESNAFAVDPSFWDSRVVACSDPLTELTPEAPTPLEPRAVEALKRWNKMIELDEALGKRPEEARVMVKSQEKRKKRRDSSGLSMLV